MNETSLADELGDEFAELRREFLDTTRDRVRELIRLLEESAGRTPSGSDGDAFRRIAHSVRGSGGSYGFDEISAAAGKLEKAYLAGDATARLAELVAGLEAEVSASIRRTSGPAA